MARQRQSSGQSLPKKKRTKINAKAAALASRTKEWAVVREVLKLDRQERVEFMQILASVVNIPELLEGAGFGYARDFPKKLLAQHMQNDPSPAPLNGLDNTATRK